MLSDSLTTVSRHSLWFLVEKVTHEYGVKPGQVIADLKTIRNFRKIMKS